MNKQAVYHKVDSEYAYAISKQDLLVKLRTAKDECTKIDVFFIDKFKYIFHNEKNIFEEKMVKKYSDDLFDYYEAVLKFDMLSMGYFFKMATQNETICYGNYKFFDKFEQEGNIAYLPELFTMPVLDREDLFVVPEWAQNSIVYQIFPERFYLGDKYIKDEKHQEWNSDVKHDSYLGGNLDGVIDKLDYLAELGINTIYLNPIFRAGYNHKYCTYDYLEIDSDFGSKETLIQLVKEAHKKGIKILLDAVFSSSGIEFAQFKDVLEKNSESPYAEWYKIEQFPVEVKYPANYKCFAYYPVLPKFNYDSQELQEYLLGVLSYWIKEADIDGWRLDVADEIPHAFWRKARKVVKSIKEDAVLIGEVWYDSTSWLNGDQFDSVMNYRFYTAVIDFIGKEKIGSDEFAFEINKYLATYKRQTHKLLWNLIDSHDTIRFRNVSENNSWEKQKLAAVLQFTMVGTPVIYYGDEAGMTGGGDPDNRRGMLWGDYQDSEMLEFYKKLIGIRKNNSCLVSGEISFESVDKNILKFVREDVNGKIVVYVNNSSVEKEIFVEGMLIDLMNREKVKGKINLEGYGFRVFRE